MMEEMPVGRGSGGFERRRLVFVGEFWRDSEVGEEGNVNVRRTELFMFYICCSLISSISWSGQ